MAAPTNESYEIKRVQSVVAACISPLMHQLGGIVGYYLHPWTQEVMPSVLNGDRWRKDDQIVVFNWSKHDHRRNELVKFSGAYYDPASDFTEGTPQLLENVNLRVDGKSKVFDNSKGGDQIHIAYEDEVDLENSVATSLKNSFTFDTTVTSETTVSGSYAGASLEQKLTAEVHAGFAKETGKDTEESKTDAETVAIEFDCPPHGIKLLEVNKDHKRELIPTKGTFILDFAIEMQFYHWWQEKAPGVKFRPDKARSLNVDSIEGLLQFAQGVDTNYPKHGGLLERPLDAIEPAGCAHAAAGPEEPQLRARRGQDARAGEQRHLQGDGPGRRRRGTVWTWWTCRTSRTATTTLVVRLCGPKESTMPRITGCRISRRHRTRPGFIGRFIDSEVIKAKLEAIDAKLDMCSSGCWKASKRYSKRATMKMNNTQERIAIMRFIPGLSLLLMVGLLFAAPCLRRSRSRSIRLWMRTGRIQVSRSPSHRCSAMASRISSAPHWSSGRQRAMPRARRWRCGSTRRACGV